MSASTLHTADDSVATASARVERFFLRVLHCPALAQVGQAFAIDAAPVVLGRRDGGANFEIDDRKVSRRHVEIRRRRDDDGVEVRDLDSRNGTFIHGQRLDSGKLATGGVLRVGDTVFELADSERPLVFDRDGLLGQSTAFAALMQRVDIVAKDDVSVLLVGETGTGKELVSHYLHRASGRRGACVSVNCAAIPGELAEAAFFGHKRGAFTGASADGAGHFARAEAGTLFLDEIGELPPPLQAKLLRALEAHEYFPVGSASAVSTSARVIAATNANLAADVKSGTFRADLYARLAGVVLRVPTLRERHGDIALLFGRFVAELAPEQGVKLSATALERLLTHPWPMNVRELRALVRRLALFGRDKLLHLRDIDELLGREPAPPQEPAPARQVPGREEPRREELVALLTQHHGAVGALAAHYGKHRKQIHRWLERHGLRAEDFA